MIQMHHSTFREIIALIDDTRQVLKDASEGNLPAPWDAAELAEKCREQADFLLELERRAYQEKEAAPLEVSKEQWDALGEEVNRLNQGIGMPEMGRRLLGLPSTESTTDKGPITKQP